MKTSNSTHKSPRLSCVGAQRPVGRDAYRHLREGGNYHAGYTGMFVGIPPALQWLGAGVVEKIKNVGEGDWDSFFGNKMTTVPFGDKLPDWLYNTVGMGDAQEEMAK